MSDALFPRSGASDSGEPSQSLTDRVLARIRAARPVSDAGPERIREARSLRRVFLDFGESYRDYRRRTGEPVSADVREAAYRFRRDPSVASLVSIAAALEELDIPTV